MNFYGFPDTSCGENKFRESVSLYNSKKLENTCSKKCT